MAAALSRENRAPLKAWRALRTFAVRCRESAPAGVLISGHIRLLPNFRDDVCNAVAQAVGPRDGGERNSTSDRMSWVPRMLCAPRSRNTRQHGKGCGVDPPRLVQQKNTAGGSPGVDWRLHTATRSTAQSADVVQ